MQRLSDFDSGFELKTQIKSLDNKVVGYCWREYNDHRGLTYCFIEPHCVAKPNSHTVLFVEIHKVDLSQEAFKVAPVHK